jgi:class 3 adenylate cyclase
LRIFTETDWSGSQRHALIGPVADVFLDGGFVIGGRVERRLAAVLAVDVAGHSRLMGADEVGTLAALKALPVLASLKEKR